MALEARNDSMLGRDAAALRISEFRAAFSRIINTNYGLRGARHEFSEVGHTVGHIIPEDRPTDAFMMQFILPGSGSICKVVCLFTGQIHLYRRGMTRREFSPLEMLSCCEVIEAYLLDARHVQTRSNT